MPDIFNTFSTRLDLGNQLPLPELGDMPKVDYNTQPLQLTQNVNSMSTPDKTKSIWDKMDADIRSIKPLEVYEYTKEEADRFGGKYGQYRPYTILGSDMEDTASQRQSAGRQLLNGTLKGVATLGGTFVSTFLSLPQEIDSVLNGEVSGWDEDSMFAKVQNWTNSFENTLPNYYSQQERNNQDNGEWYKNVFTSNFLGDKFIKNLGFTVGAIGATIVTDAALALIPGVGEAGMVSNTANALSKMKSAWNAASNIAKSKPVVDAVINGSRTATNLFNSAKSMAQASRAVDGLGFALKTYLSAQGEAAIEGYHTYKDTQDKLYRKALSGEITPEQAQNIQADAMEAGRLVANYNLPLLAISNAIQFKNILSGKGRFGQQGSKWIKNTVENGVVKTINNYSKKEAYKGLLKEVGRDMITEGLEEGSQNYLSSSIHDYHMDKYNPGYKDGLLDYVYNNKDKYINSQLLEEMFIGGLTGALTGGIGGAVRDRGMKEKTDNLIEHLKPSVDRFNSAIRHMAVSDENNVSEFDSNQNALKGLYVSTLENKKFGNMESFYESIATLKDFDHNEFNTAFGSKFLSKEEKDTFIGDTLSKVQKIEKTIEYVDAAYSNPYAKGFKRTIQKIFSPKNELEEQRISEDLFNQWKETVGYNLVQLANHKDTQSVLENGLKSKSFNSTEAIEFFKTFRRGNSKGIDKYVTYKKTQLKALRDELSYQRKLAKETESAINTSAIEDRIEEIENLLTGLNDNKSKLKKVYETDESIPEEENEIRDNLFGAIIAEEISEEDQQAYSDRVEEFIAERKKQADQIKEEAEKLNNVSHHVEQAENEAIDNQSPNPLTAQQIAEMESRQAVFSEEDDSLEGQANTATWEEELIGNAVSIGGKTYDVDSIAGNDVTLKGEDEVVVITKTDEGFIADTPLPNVEEGEYIDVEVQKPEIEFPKLETESIKTEIPQLLEDFEFTEGKIIKDSKGNVYKVLLRDNRTLLQKGTIKLNKFIKDDSAPIRPFPDTFAEVILNPEVKSETQEDKLNKFLVGTTGYKGIFSDLLKNNKIEIEC